MDDNVEHRADHMQRPDGRFTADEIGCLMETLIKAGGFFNIGLVMFHLAFWRLFNWDEDLKKISFLNRAVMQVLNISLIFAFVIFSYISLAHTKELVSTPLGHSLVMLMALFWF